MKKFLTVFFTFTLYFNLVTQAHAAVGGWTMSNPVAQGASTVYTGTKNIIINGADYVKKGTAIVTPTATGVAKVLARGAAGYALSVAVEQLLGAVDWVLDPANNQIKYTDPNQPTSEPNGGTWQYASPFNIYYNNPLAAAKGFGEHFFQGCKNYSQVSRTQDQYAWAYYQFECYWNDQRKLINVTGHRVSDEPIPEENEEKTLPLDVVAQQVISNAEAGDTSSQAATTAAAADIVAEAEKDDAKARPIAQQLEANATTKPDDEAAAEKENEASGEQTKNPDKPDTTDIKLTFPIFCNWAPTVCQAAQTVITFPTTLTEWWTTGKEKSESWATSISQSWSEAKDWFTSPPEEPQKIDIPTKDLTEKSFLLNVITVNGAYCPADKSIEWDTPVGHFSKTVSYQNFCDASEWFGYLVLAAAYYMGALIVVRDS
jgi:hypothetical protein